MSAVAARSLARGGGAGSREAGVASPEHDAAELLAHVLGHRPVAPGRWSTSVATPTWRRTTRCSRGGRPASRSST